MALPSEASASALQAFLLEYVPLARAAQIRVDAYDGSCLKVSAPLDANINDKGTAFGGSLYNLCVIAGWGMTCLLSQELGLDGDLVVAKGEIDYLRPLRGDLAAQVYRPEALALQHFHDYFLRKGRASLMHEIEVLDESGQPCVRFKGKYAIVKTEA